MSGPDAGGRGGARPLASHSPLPWKWYGEGPHLAYVVMDDNEGLVAEGILPGDAALIVSAVNSHAEREAELARLRHALGASIEQCKGLIGDLKDVGARAMRQSEELLVARETAAAAARLLLDEACVLRRWASESKRGGWSTHQVEPMRRRADLLEEHADRLMRGQAEPRRDDDPAHDSSEASIHEVDEAHPLYGTPADIHDHELEAHPAPNPTDLSAAELIDALGEEGEVSGALDRDSFEGRR